MFRKINFTNFKIQSSFFADGKIIKLTVHIIKTRAHLQYMYYLVNLSYF